MAEPFSNPEGYERQMGPRSSALGPRFIAFAGVRDGDRVLDVGSGTGSLAIALTEFTSCSEIVGIDPSSPFIEFARTRTHDPRTRFETGDAMNLPYTDNYFDKSLTQLVLNQVPDAGQVLREMCRVTKPGGTVAACIWARGKDNEIGWIFWEAAMAVDATAAQHRETGGRYGGKGRLAALWAECALREIKEADLVISIDFASFDDFWLPHLEGQARAGAYVKSLTVDRRDALRAQLRRNILGTKRDGVFSLRAKVLAVRGIC